MSSPLRFDPTDQKLLYALQNNFIEYFRPFQTLPNAIWHEDEESTWIIVHGAPGNQVLSVNLSGDVDNKLHDLIIQHGKSTNFMRWLPMPIDAPANLADRLAALGMKRNNNGEPVMIANLDTLPSASQVTGLTIVRVNDEIGLRDWQRATGDGFGSGYNFAAIWGDTYLKKGLAADNPFMHFTGYMDGMPVTSASLLLAGGIAGVYDVSTVPAYRKRGLGRAITLTAMSEAAQRGYQVAYLRASHEGFNVYRSLGFKTLFHEVECFWEAETQHGSD